MPWNVYGHEWAVKLLQQHIASREVRHAYLFTGPAGVGRRTLALRFAQALNCPTPAAPGQPCGVCRTCAQIERMQQTDLSVVQAEVEGGTLRVEQVRELQHSLSLRPYESAWRVAMLLRFQEANANAQNALLKTLEEAPAYVVLLLTADSAESLLPTVASRCEILRLRPLAVAELERLLQTERHLSAEEARLLAHLAGGRPGYALRLLAQPEILEQRREFLDDLIYLLGANRRQRFAYVDQLYRDKARLRFALQTWLGFWRDLLLAASNAGAPPVNLDREEQLERLAGNLDLARVHRCTAALEQALVHLDDNLNTRLQAEVLLLDWPRVPVEALP